MLFQKAALQDVPEISRMVVQAQRWFAENGIDQWQNGYPNEESVRKDIAAGSGVLLREQGRVVCYASLSFLPEPNYAEIDGVWRCDGGDYAVLHRVVTERKHKGKGLAGELFARCEAAARLFGIQSLRADTHRDNLPMQRALKKFGFLPCGTIHLADGSPRLAFEKPVQALLPRFHHAAIWASDYDRTIEFYVKKLGLNILRENRRPERGDCKLDLRVGDGELEIFIAPGHPPRVSNPEALGLRHLAFRVEDCEAAARELNRRGIETEPVRTDEFSGGKFTFLRDPDGLPLELHE
jgi:glyoxylase I family protein